jgi:hypothetical protein
MRLADTTGSCNKDVVFDFGNGNETRIYINNGTGAFNLKTANLPQVFGLPLPVDLDGTGRQGFVSLGGDGYWIVPVKSGQACASLTRILAVSESGRGTVTSSPAGINCGSTCNASFAVGTQITLTATAAGGSSFTGWGGACSGAGACTITMNSDQSVTASFSSNNYTLSVSLVGSPGGKVTSSPSGIDCGSTCSASFAAGSKVTLAASPAAAWGLAGWGGACNGIGNCTVTMNAYTSVSTSFTTLFTAAPAPVATSPADTPVLPPPILSPVPQPATAY